MRSFFEKLKLRFLVLATFLSTVFGGVVTYLRTCGTQTAVVTTQIVSNPANQIAATEAASFVANLFYEGADDPFPTAGMGGELASICKTLKKGHKDFVPIMNKVMDKIDVIIKTSQKLTPPKFKTQEGARAISKKLGHIESKNLPFKSAFDGTKISQENAEILIKNIVNETDAIVIDNGLVKMFNSKGQGLSIDIYNAKFVGFVERKLEKTL